MPAPRLRTTRTLSPGTANRLLVAALALLCCCSAALAQTAPSVSVRPAAGAPVRPAAESPGDVLVVVDGKLVNAENIEVARGGQIMVWLRELEKLGWGAVDASAGEDIRFVGKGVTLSFTRGQGIARVNSLAVRLPIDTYSRDGRLMVPLSFVAKALGFEYEAAPKTVAMVRTSPSPTRNAIMGTVLYDGKPVEGVVVRAADADFTVVKNVMAKTDSAGKFLLSPLPDGRFMAYVYTGDNPRYFNRASELADLNGGQQAEVKPIAIGRVLAGEKPKSGSKVSLAKTRVEFAWTACPGAASYAVNIAASDEAGAAYYGVSNKPSVSVASSKLTAGLRYVIRVSALNAAGESLGATADVGGEAWVFEAVK
jgi:hypothetical protein